MCTQPAQLWVLMAHKPNHIVIYVYQNICEEKYSWNNVVDKKIGKAP